MVLNEGGNFDRLLLHKYGCLLDYRMWIVHFWTGEMNAYNIRTKDVWESESVIIKAWYSQALCGNFRKEPPPILVDSKISLSKVQPRFYDNIVICDMAVYIAQLFIK